MKIKHLSDNWWARHLLIILIAVTGSFLLLESRANWSEMHRWNRAVGDMSVILIALTMIVGPVVRIWPKMNVLTPWRRECGIYAVILAIVHTVIIFSGWIEWDFLKLVGYQIHPATGQYVMAQQGFGLANILGIIALLYGIVLAMSSNNLSMKLLGGSVWKFIQQGSYVLWMLVVTHTAYFLYIHFLHFHRPLPDPNWAQWPFAVLVGVALMLQLAATFKTWKIRSEKRGYVQGNEAV